MSDDKTESQLTAQRLAAKAGSQAAAARMLRIERSSYNDWMKARKPMTLKHYLEAKRILKEDRLCIMSNNRRR